MIIDLNRLTIDQNIIFDKLFNDSKLEYISLIDNIYEQSDKSIYFLLSSVTSRDLYLNGCIIKLTQLRLIKYYLLNNNAKKIIVYDQNQYKVICSLLRKNNTDAEMILISSYKEHIINAKRLISTFLINIKTVISFIKVKIKSY
mgnify:CR=1 FL=1